MTPRERRTVGLRHPIRLVLLLLAVVVAFGAAGCGRDEESSSNGAGAEATTGDTTAQNLSGRIEIDGSSTVGPLSTLAAEQFQQNNTDVQVTVGVSGTGGGFERFCAGETDISDASRPIKEDEEVPVCQKAGIEYTEFQVAVDALTVVVNSENDWIDCITTDQLKKIWEPKSKIKNWNQVDPSFPDQKLTLAGPGTDSGTFDYFTDEINGEEGASRSDYTASEDDNVIVQAVEGDKGGLGYFGFTYYEENQDRLKALEVDSGSGCIAPSAETAQNGEYTPLSRPLFIYVKNDSLTKPEVKAFVQYYLDNATTIAEDGQFIPAPEDVLAKDKAEFEQATRS
jgi:phosphate transport system substrate-binding protein